MGIDKVLAKFPNAKKTGDGWITRCPAHDDHNPSLSIWIDEKKKVGLNCSQDATIRPSWPPQVSPSQICTRILHANRKAETAGRKVV